MSCLVWHWIGENRDDLWKPMESDRPAAVETSLGVWACMGPFRTEIQNRNRPPVVSQVPELGKGYSREKGLLPCLSKHGWRFVEPEKKEYGWVTQHRTL